MLVVVLACCTLQKANQVGSWVEGLLRNYEVVQLNLLVISFKSVEQGQCSCPKRIQFTEEDDEIVADASQVDKRRVIIMRACQIGYSTQNVAILGEHVPSRGDDSDEKLDNMGRFSLDR